MFILEKKEVKPILELWDVGFSGRRHIGDLTAHSENTAGGGSDAVAPPGGHGFFHTASVPPLSSRVGLNSSLYLMVGQGNVEQESI